MRSRRNSQWTERLWANGEGGDVLEIRGRVYFNRKGMVNCAMEKKGEMKTDRVSLDLLVFVNENFSGDFAWIREY